MRLTREQAKASREKVLDATAGLSAEALGHAFGQMATERERQPDLATLVRHNLSRGARAGPARICHAIAVS